MITPNLLQFLRRSNFGPTPTNPYLQPQIPMPQMGQMPEQQMPIQSPIQEPMPGMNIPDEPTPYDPNADLASFVPKTQMSEAFNQGLGSMPQRQNFQPSGWRKAAGVFAGLGADSPANAFLVSRGIMDEPFNRAQGDWKEKQDLLTKATQMEDLNNRAAQTAKLGEVQKKLTAQGQEDTRLKNERANKVAENKLKLADWVAKNPHIEWKKTGEYWTAMNPATGQGTQTKFKTGDMTEQELEAMKQKGRMAVVGAQQVGATERNTARIAGDIALKSTPTGTDPNAANSQIERGEKAEIARLVQDFPEHFDSKTGRLLPDGLKEKGWLMGEQLSDWNANVKLLKIKLDEIEKKYQYSGSKPSGVVKPTNVTKSGVTFEVIK